MTDFSQATASGDGSRPTTSGGVDNIGGASKLTSAKSAAGEQVEGPAPAEGMAAKRKDVESTRHDDAAAFGLKENFTPDPNQEPVPKTDSQKR